MQINLKKGAKMLSRETKELLDRLDRNEEIRRSKMAAMKGCEVSELDEVLENDRIKSEKEIKEYKLANKKTRYSKCECGETAFDRKQVIVIQNEKQTYKSRYLCRNCMRELKTKYNQ